MIELATDQPEDSELLKLTSVIFYYIRCYLKTNSLKKHREVVTKLLLYNTLLKNRNEEY